MIEIMMVHVYIYSIPKSNSFYLKTNFMSSSLSKLLPKSSPYFIGENYNFRNNTCACTL